MSVVCGTTTGAADSKISNRPVTFESNLIGIVRFEFESNLEASQVPSSNLGKCRCAAVRVKVLDEEEKERVQKTVNSAPTMLLEKPVVTDVDYHSIDLSWSAASLPPNSTPTSFTYVTASLMTRLHLIHVAGPDTSCIACRRLRVSCIGDKIVVTATCIHLYPRVEHCLELLFVYIVSVDIRTYMV